ncbi:2-oxoacid:acceptor oxidoreductase subunit alpha [Sedimentisphaera salicampi]|uniref:2-oxoglutarate oxidoreductase subunit KorA n=1 Tax=Sedimentisphaera salicampi TaxID=1941349 RepID=A0A1W6LML7_9BACT|nr:2-oxoacid:acceptor oxidoreductase subunit alpha [Sedimentisphaera salicampi]ARN57019.1 2-oxoglutarate oxidoreductase subunit KorA [Sedimentisphaera salicampi]
MNALRDKNAGVSIVLCGQAGQGIQTVEKLLTSILKASGWNVFATKEYMSRIRGGTNSTLIRAGAGPVRSFINRIDVLAALDKSAGGHLAKRISPHTLIMGEKEVLEGFGDKGSFFEAGFSQAAKDLGGKVYANTVAVGALLRLLGIPAEKGKEPLEKFFAGKSDEIIEKNQQALKKGFEMAEKPAEDFGAGLKLSGEPDVQGKMLVNGAQAVGLGALAGGCNFISSYPMSPSTAVLAFLAQQGGQFGLLAEQAEDEIAAVNMAIGAWYAGARAMITTSGGGFALMGEGVSLAGMMESPLVMHAAQRPGPATGLPTRTEQGDLELALYSGHGEFPRIILAPGTLSEAFSLAKKAFNLADKYQVPVIILTDQYFMDSYYNTETFSLDGLDNSPHITETDKDYLRYRLTENGISPRGVPGFGDGLVCQDSDEHDEQGRITEDLELRVKMNDKRLKKLEAAKADYVQPSLEGAEDYENLIICWGSNYNIVKEAIELSERGDTAMLHFSQVYPTPEDALAAIKKAKKTAVLENNATGQFAKLLKLQLDFEPDEKILKYDGLPFAADTLSEKINEMF